MPRETLFDRVPAAKAAIAANYVRPGNYLARIDAIKYMQARKGYENLIFEMTIVHVFDDDDGKANDVGEEVSHIFSGKHEAAPGNIKASFAALLGQEPEAVPANKWKRVCIRIVSEEQPLAGQFTRINVRIKVTKAGGDFTLITFTQAMKANDPELLEILDEDEQAEYLGVKRKKKTGTKAPAKPIKKTKPKPADEEEDDEEDTEDDDEVEDGDEDDDDDEGVASLF